MSSGERRRAMGAVKVPADQIVDLAKIIEQIGGNGARHQGVMIEDLHVLVEEGMLTLNDSGGTYGTRRFGVQP